MNDNMNNCDNENINENINKNNNENINENINEYHKDDKDFLKLDNYPSFASLNFVEKEKIKNNINELLEKGKIQRWLIGIDELKIGEEIGKGSNSYINNCIWRNLEIVVKKPKEKKLFLLVDLLKEIDLWSSLRHPYLVQFLGACYDKDNEDFYIMLEKIHGYTLSDYIENKSKSKNKSFSKYAKYQICTQLINVIKFLHSCNPPIIYRDLKPENIMIDNFNNVHLTDFGLSRYMPEQSNYNLTGGTGTIRYMAPEVYLHKNYDLKVDIYSLGFIFYYIFTGIKPFINYNVNTIKEYMNNPDIIHSTENIKNKQWKDIIDNCIRRDPDLRWDIDQLSDAIQKLTFQDTGFNCIMS